MKLYNIELIIENLGKRPKPIIDISIPEISCIYLLFNKDLELLYIGQTTTLRKRLVMHLSPITNSRPKTKEDINFNKGCSSIIPLDDPVKYFSFIESTNENERKFLEITLNYVLKPKYNTIFEK